MERKKPIISEEVKAIKALYSMLKTARTVLSWEEFADQIKYGRVYISRVINGHEPLTKELKAKIYETFGTTNNVPHGTSKKGGFNPETAHQELINYLSDLKTAQQNLWNQGQVVRQEIAGVADYMMLKDAEWDPEKMKTLKETYYKIVRGAPPEAVKVNRLKGNHKSGRG